MNIKIMSKNLRPGMRTIKTGIAIFICLLLGYLLNYFWPIYACIAAIVSMQDTSIKSLEIGKARLIGTGIGGVLGILFLWLSTFIPFDEAKIILATLAVILSLMLCVFIEQKQACSICSVVVLGILLMHKDSDYDIYFYAFTRTVETAIGVVISFLVNRFLWTNRFEDDNNDNPPNDATNSIDAEAAVK